MFTGDAAASEHRALCAVVYVELTLEFNCSEAADNDAINIKKVFTDVIVAR